MLAAITHAIGSLCVRGGDLDQARLQFQTAVELDPSEPEYAAALADVWLRLGDRGEAESVLGDARRRHPTSARLHAVARAIAEDGTGRWSTNTASGGRSATIAWRWMR